MSTYLDEKRRRIEQFTQYLRLMAMRRHKIVTDDCFIIFNESAPEDTDNPQVREWAAATVDCTANGGQASGDTGLLEPSSADWRPDESSPRFVQFAFRQDCFYMELPKSTLFPNEAGLILQQRPGFYWARKRPDLCWVRATMKDMCKWDPLQKMYVYRDEESAAEDMAFILYQVWKFPLDSRFYVTAAAFNGKCDWEKGFPLA
jgi:hypothetical protein